MAQVEEKESPQKFMWAPLPETSRGYSLQIDGCKKNHMMAYTNGRFVFTRSLEDLSVSTIFTEHKTKVNVARFSPNGEWIASGDNGGKVIIWGVKSKNIKLEVQVNRKVIDLSWSDDGQRIVAVGDGSESYAKVFTWDSGNNIGEIVGHSKMIISCQYKPSRPYKIITASEDNSVVFHQGPPFKMQSVFREHTRYPNCVRFTPDGSKFISVGADRQIFLFDGKEGTKIKEFGLDPAANGHTASILSASWSGDGKMLLTASMDRTARLWDVEAGHCVKVWTLGEGIPNQQVGTLWVDDFVVSVGLNGFMHFLNIHDGTIVKTVKGHQNNITGLVFDAPTNSLYTCDNNGQVLCWALADGSQTMFGGEARNDKPINALTLNATAGQIITAGADNCVHWTTMPAGQNDLSLPVGNLPQLVCNSPNGQFTAVSLMGKQLVLFRGGAAVQTLEVAFEITALAFAPNNLELAVGCADNKVRFYKFVNNQLVFLDEVNRHDAAVSAIAYSPDGQHVVTAGKDRLIYIWEASTRQLRNDGWQLHTGMIFDMAFTPSGDKLITVSIDQSIIVWKDLTNKNKHVQFTLAHIGGVEHLRVLSDSSCVTTGADRTIRQWSF